MATFDATVDVPPASFERLGECTAIITTAGCVDRHAWEAVLAVLLEAIIEGRRDFVLDLSEGQSFAPGAAERLVHLLDMTVGDEAVFVIIAPCDGRLTEIEVLARRRDWPVALDRSDALATLLSVPV